MLYFTANKLTIKPYLKHLANELHLFGCYMPFSELMIKLEHLREENLLENHVWKYFIVENIEYVQKSDKMEISENSEENYIVLTEFHLNNGKKFNGYCSRQDASGIDYIQPVIFTENGQIAFYREKQWSEKEKTETCSFLGLNFAEIFPVKYKTKILCDGKFHRGSIIDFNVGKNVT